MSSLAIAANPAHITDQATASALDPALIDVVHELRAPLAAITGALKLLGAGQLGTIGEDAARMLAIAHENSQRMARLIDGLLITTLFSGGTGETWESIDLAKFLDQAIRFNQNLLTGNGAFVLTPFAAPAVIRGKRDALHQVMSNLLSNAVKFSPAGAQVGLALGRTSTGFRVSVSDHGRGIPPSFRPKLFQRFARAPETAARVPGSGLGLSIAHAIVRAHGGDLTCDSNAGHGTIFHVDLPDEASS